MAYRMVSHGGNAGYGQWSPQAAQESLIGRALPQILDYIRSQGGFVTWAKMAAERPHYINVLKAFPMASTTYPSAPGYYLRALASDGGIQGLRILAVPEEHIGGFSGYGSYGVIASAQNIARMQKQLKMLKDRKKKVTSKTRKKILTQRIKKLKAKIQKARAKTRKIAKRRKDKGKEISDYRKRSLKQARKKKRGKAGSAMKPGTAAQKSEYPWAYRSTPPKWFLRKKSPEVRRNQWGKMSPEQRIARYHRSRQRAAGVKAPQPKPYQRPPQPSPYEPNGQAMEQDFAMEAGMPSTDMDLYSQDDAMAAAELDSGVDVDGELDYGDEDQKRKMMPVWIGLGVLGLGGAAFLLMGQKKKKVKTKRKVTYR